MQWTVASCGDFAIPISALVLPGPDFTSVLRSTLARGPRAGLLTRSAQP
ncbi:MAG: hypothetical protein Q8S27_14825 [Hoeflea sp.]|nr:hypothetical protein [Hoeflea sp.]